MSVQERQELEALSVWLQTFPQIDQSVLEKENAGANKIDVLGDADLADYIFEVALEICHFQEDGAESTMAVSGDLWDTVLTMTQRAGCGISSKSKHTPGGKRNSLQPPSQDTPHVWDDYVKHAAVANLLDGAVAHQDLQQRKIYIGRIMGLPSQSQRSLMSLIERRKTKGKTPSKGATSSRKAAANSATPIPLASATPSRNRQASPGDTNMMRSPFSPMAECLAKAMSPSNSEQKEVQHSTSRRKSVIRKGRSLFKSPSGNSGNTIQTPRRSFDQAFGISTSSAPGTMSPPDSALPSPKRMLNNEDASFFSPGLGDSSEYERQFQALKERNEQLERDLTKKETKEDELKQQLEVSESTFRKEMIRVETIARRQNEDAQHDYQSHLQNLQSELTMVQQQLTDTSQTKAQLASVQDELEVLVHTKAQLAEKTERLQTYKEKIQQLTDVKEALIREEEAHSKSVEGCLRLENELSALKPLKRHLEEYKTRAVEAEVKLTDCQDELIKLKEQWLTNTDTNFSLEHAMHSQQEEIEELRSRIHHNSSSQEQVASGVGDGLSELNPELKEEVFRLRNENHQLRAFAAKREDDAVVRMEQSLEDAARLGDRYKSQFLSTKDQLENSQRNLQASRDRESKLRKDASEAMEKIKLTQGMVEDVSQQLYHCNEELTTSRNRESELEGELASWVDQAKNLQEKGNQLSVQLQARNNELESSKGREMQLHQEISGWEKEHNAIQKLSVDLGEQLRTTEKTLKASQAHEVDLREQLDQWTTKADAFEEEAKKLLGDVNQCTKELDESRDAEQRLTKALSETSLALTEAKAKTEDLTIQLSETMDSLVVSQEALAQAHQQEEVLEVQLADMSTRAEDSETISKQRMELVQSTRDKLKACKAEVENLTEQAASLEVQVVSWTKKAEVAQAQADQLESNFFETSQKLSATKDQLDDTEDQVTNLNQNAQHHALQLEEWKSKAESSEMLTERLQGELVQMREILSETQVTLQTSRSDHSTMEDSVTHAEHTISRLEEQIEAEREARQEVESCLEGAQQTMAKTQQVLEDTKAKLTVQIQDEIEQGNKLKQELFHMQETLTELQGSFGASQHREKMLKHELTKFQDRHDELERELENGQKNAGVSADEAAKSLDATREVLTTKARKEVEEIQDNMNNLLEDERQAKRQADEGHKCQTKQLQHEFDTQLASLKSTSNMSLDEVQRANHEQTDSLKADYEAQLTEIKRNADAQNDQLVAKGKGMLKEVRLTARQEHDALRNEFEQLEAKLHQEQSETRRIIVQAKTKVAEYKKKLQFTSNRINSLSADSDDLEEKVKNLERDKFKLAEENDRYRRQLGGRGGPDSKLQSQVDLLQKEFQSAMEETRELRRQLKEKDGGMVSLSALPSINEDSDHSYSRDAVNQSTLGQLRTEYEETIEALNDEKRELVMKNSAAITDVQKAEQRAWESEEDNSSMKQHVTSLQLQVERLEHLLTDNEEPPPPPPPPKRKTRASTRKEQAAQAARTPIPPQDHDESFDVVNANQPFLSSMSTEGIDPPPVEHETSELSEAVKDAQKEPRILAANGSCLNKQTTSMDIVAKLPLTQTDLLAAKDALPSFVELHGVTPGQDAPPECKQS